MLHDRGKAATFSQPGMFGDQAAGPELDAKPDTEALLWAEDRAPRASVWTPVRMLMVAGLVPATLVLLWALTLRTSWRLPEPAPVPAPSGLRLASSVPDAPPAPSGTAAPGSPPASGEVFRDCPHCPEMVVIPGGAFLMGSPEAEAGRDEDEGSQRQVTVGAFAIGRFEVTVDEFAHFVRASGHVSDAERHRDEGCYGWDARDEEWEWREGRSWRQPGYAQTGRHPVVCVSWADAQAYVIWLSRETGQRYHLPSEAQWEYATRAGSSTSRPWGDSPKLACRHGNVADRTRPPDGSPSWSGGHACRDGYWFTAPVGSFAANAFGLHDMIGNVWEWTQDCYEEDGYDGQAPRDGRAYETASCANRVLRGASWSSTAEKARSAFREADTPSNRDDDFGFRVVRRLK